MESLPDAIVQDILSLISNAMDVACCKCVSKRWKDSMPYLRRLFFPRNIFNNLNNGDNPDVIISRMVLSVVKLEELVVYCPFSCSSLALWLSITEPSLKNLELRMDSVIGDNRFTEIPSKLDCIGAASNLESLKLWGVLMIEPPKWNVFRQLKNLEIVGASLNNYALIGALRACPNLTHLVVLGCEGVRSVSIENPNLRECTLDLVGTGNSWLALNSRNLELLDVQGFSSIGVSETRRLKTLSISNNSGRVYFVDFGKLESLETLSLQGIQWCWDALNKMLQTASEVKHLYMKVEFTGDSDVQPFPEVDFVDFFNNHPNLETFGIHGAMFAALCHENSLKNVDSNFFMPCLEKVVVSVRSTVNAELKMRTLETFIKYAKDLRKMTIKILLMEVKSIDMSNDDFFKEICKLKNKNRRNRKIVSIE